MILRQAPSTGAIGQPVTRTDEYYYDGVRRLQATVNRPTSFPPNWEREYVYGTEYVDEFLYQVSRDGDAVYMIQDANYNVVATFDDAGTLEQQYQYEPYGEIVAADEGVAEPKVNHVGHQGLFIERMDYPDNAPKFEPGSNAVYYNRNRWYNPRLGRYLQRDPGGTALQLQSELIAHAQLPSLAPTPFDHGEQFVDGPNLFQYVRGNPVLFVDPNGSNAASTIYGLAGGPVYSLPAMLGYIAGAVYASFQDFGPGTGGGIANMVINRFGPGYLQGTPSGYAEWLLIDVAPEVAPWIIRAAMGSVQYDIATGILRQTYSVQLGPAMALAAPALIGGGFYAGVLESVLWSVEEDMTGDAPDWGNWPF